MVLQINQYECQSRSDIQESKAYAFEFMGHEILGGAITLVR
jgi:hypothetical protein